MAPIVKRCVEVSRSTLLIQHTLLTLCTYENSDETVDQGLGTEGVIGLGFNRVMCGATLVNFSEQNYY